VLHTTRTCNRCGCTIEGQGSLLTPSGELCATLDRIDLCEPCGLALVGWLRSEVKDERRKAS
jgi:transposase